MRSIPLALALLLSGVVCARADEQYPPEVTTALDALASITAELNAERSIAYTKSGPDWIPRIILNWPDGPSAAEVGGRIPGYEGVEVQLQQDVLIGLVGGRKVDLSEKLDR